MLGGECKQNERLSYIERVVLKLKLSRFMHSLNN